MKKVILVVGPSGVGKSDYCKYAEDVIPDCHFFDLDSLVGKLVGIAAGQLLPRVGKERFFEYGKEEVASLLKSSSQEIVIIAVGAGFLQSSRAGPWLSEHPGPTVAVFALAEEVYQRWQMRRENCGKPLDPFKQEEYSPQRLCLYRIAQHQLCVSGLTAGEARARFSNMIINVLKDGA